MLADLGVSSPQVDRPERGFSYRADRDGPLDMRMDQSRGPTAADLLAEVDEDDLVRALRDLADEPHARRVARAMVEAEPRTTERAGRGRPRRAARPPGAAGATPPSASSRPCASWSTTRSAPSTAPSTSPSTPSSPAGRMAVISFHSVEDRMVKTRFREAADGGCTCPPGLPCVCGAEPTARLLRRKPWVADEAERAANSRATSARLAGRRGPRPRGAAGDPPRAAVAARPTPARRARSTEGPAGRPRLRVVPARQVDRTRVRVVLVASHLGGVRGAAAGRRRPHHDRLGPARARPGRRARHRGDPPEPVPAPARAELESPERIVEAARAATAWSCPTTSPGSRPRPPAHAAPDAHRRRVRRRPHRRAGRRRRDHRRARRRPGRSRGMTPRRPVTGAFDAYRAGRADSPPPGPDDPGPTTGRRRGGHRGPPPSPHRRPWTVPPPPCAPPDDAGLGPSSGAGPGERRPGGPGRPPPAHACAAGCSPSRSSASCCSPWSASKPGRTSRSATPSATWPRARASGSPRCPAGRARGPGRPQRPGPGPVGAPAHCVRRPQHHRRPRRRGDPAGAAAPRRPPRARRSAWSGEGRFTGAGPGARRRRGRRGGGPRPARHRDLPGVQAGAAQRRPGPLGGGHGEHRRRHRHLRAGGPARRPAHRDRRARSPTSGRKAPGRRRHRRHPRRIEPARPGAEVPSPSTRPSSTRPSASWPSTWTRAGAKGGTAIISRPSTGEVLALANLGRDDDSGTFAPRPTTWASPPSTSRARSTR